MSLSELLLVAPPPTQPLEMGTLSDWQEVEKRFGLPLPPDLYQLCVRYGSGWFGRIQVHNPFAESYHDTVEQALETMRFLKQSLGNEAVPYQLYPEKPGLFPAGREDNGGLFFYLTEGKSHDWPLLLWEKGTKWETMNMPVTDFLARALKNELECDWWGCSQLDECDPEEPRFRPRQQS